MKILLLDIETAPLRAYVWGLWKQNVSPTKQLLSDQFMLTWSAKWHGEEKVHGDKLKPKEAIAQHDGRIMESLHKLMEQADVVVGHNSDKFDLPIINTRFILNDLPPVAPAKRIDTLKLAKRHFRFTSNRLDYIAQKLCDDAKMDTGGFELWDGCMQGDKAALQKMLDYNMQDVIILEKVFDKLRPYATTLPSMSVHSDSEDHVCPSCGGNHVQKRGFSYTNTSKFQRYQCTDCGSWSRGRQNLRNKEQMATTLQSI